ncbi:terpenoid synthase [Periconia macrospinosa]|uniref:Terpenoid synthase n=1 Tax=Periconia macrospinosa TaxID=97972 RepID=A0A2V1E0Q3_9PLEO|nr:terpenoid synthase [Periconia macrospinosa]
MDFFSSETITKTEYDEIISQFLHDMDFKMPSHEPDPAIQARALQHFSIQPNWPPHLKEKALLATAYIAPGVALCSPSAPFETRLMYGIHASYVLFIDDISHDLGTALNEFEPRLVAGQEQKSPILQSFVNFQLSNRKHLGAYGASINTKSTIEFINGLILEQMYDGKVTAPRGVLSFPRYLREKTGFSEPYAHFVFPEALFPEKKYLPVYLPILQALTDFINYTNDITSFYKESIVGCERFNYIYNIASTRGLSIGEALKLVCDDVVANVQVIRRVLMGHPEMLKVAEEFFQEYVAFHLRQPRYMMANSEGVRKR